MVERILAFPVKCGPDMCKDPESGSMCKYLKLSVEPELGAYCQLFQYIPLYNQKMETTRKNTRRCQECMDSELVWQVGGINV